MRTSDKLENISKALNKAQGSIKGAKKDAENPFFKSSYADLQSIWEAISEPLSANGLSVLQMSSILPDGRCCIVTRILHISGEWLEGDFPVIAAKPNDPQAFGSAVSYARRYALAAALGVYQIDDDGNKATQASKPNTKPLTKEYITPLNPETCTHKWLESKYNNKEEYCHYCKTKRPVEKPHFAPLPR